MGRLREHSGWFSVVLSMMIGASPSLAQDARRAIPSPPVSQTPGTDAIPLPPLPPTVRNDMSLRLKPAPLEATDVPLPINLATALRLSDDRPLVIAAAQAGVWVAEANLTRAKVLWVPKLNVGFDYIRHDGGGPDFNKGILTAPSVNYFYAGAGLDQYVAVTDAIFEPLAAKQALNARHWDVQTAKNFALKAAADAYFDVHRKRGSYAGALYTVTRGRDLVARVDKLSRDLVPRDEVDRAKNILADLEQEATSAREAWRISSADLTQVLRLDPRAVVVPQEHDHLQVTLIDPAKPLDDLIPIALVNRPELASYKAQIEEAIARVRQEKMRPVLPTVMINGFQASGGMLLQAGVFGIGPNSSLNQWSGRVDTSFQLVWQLEGFGIGNAARIKKRRGQESEAVIRLRNTQDRVVMEVTRAQARLQSASARVEQADRALRSAIITFDASFDGLQQTQRFGDVLVLINRPQEVVFALKQVKGAFDDYFDTVAEYNQSQFAMFYSLGYPSQELSTLRPPGDVQPVDIARPAYLPGVQPGPPRATR